MADIVLHPHCDLHVALHGTHELDIIVWLRTQNPDKLTYKLKDVTSDCSFDFFAPYNDVGQRLEHFVAEIDPDNGAVKPLRVGTNFVQIRYKSHYLIARIQVHDTILAWWFGNASITTAVRKQVGRGEASSGLAFDSIVAVPVPQTPP